MSMSEQQQVAVPGQQAPAKRNPDLPVLMPTIGMNILEIGSMVAKSGLFPQMTMERAVTIMAIGEALGIKPVPSIQNIVVVEGKIFMEYPLVGTIIKSAPGYDYVEHADSDDKKCAIDFIRNGVVVGTYTITIDDAKRAGLVKDRSAWVTWPKVMLFARALTQGQRRYIPEVMGGMTIYDRSEQSEIAANETPRQAAQNLTAQVKGTVTTADGTVVNSMTGEVINGEVVESTATDPSSGPSWPNGDAAGNPPADIVDPFKLQS
jgi:hypothetical protein